MSRTCRTASFHAAVAAAFLGLSSVAGAGVLRVATYNTQDDVSGSQDPGRINRIATVLEGIGQQRYAGDGVQQVPDIIALQETTYSSSLKTTPTLVSTLNNFYAGTPSASAVNYTYDAAVRGTTTGGTGGGPSDFIYNSKTVTLVGAVGVGVATGSGSGAYQGEFRQVLRYEFQPVGGAAPFYVYTVHMKAGDAGTGTGSNGYYRNKEAAIVRNDAATLPAGSSILYTGDFNMDGSTEAAYQTMTSPAQVNAAVDPLNVANNYTQNWHSSAYKSILTDSVSTLQYRDDVIYATSNILSDSPGAALSLIANSYHAFGNNGTTAYQTSTNQPSTNTSLADIVGYGSLTPSQVFAAMNASTGSDHLPVVADFSFAAIPEPGDLLWAALAPAVCLRRRRR